MVNTYWVYIATNRSNTLYTGITNNLARRMYEHQNQLIDGFTKRYNINKLVYYQLFDNPKDAIEAEKKVKSWTRRKKVALIKNFNPFFNDLSDKLK